MRNNEWGKTLLYVYKYLERVTDSIDKLVSQNALNSFYYNRGSEGENNVLSVANRIIKLCERKSKLINIKVLVDKCLCLIEKKSAQILIERYIDGDSFKEIMTRHNLIMRTYFRHLHQAEQSFSQAMARLGFNSQKISSYLAEEKWIMEIYKKFLTEEEEDVAA